MRITPAQTEIITQSVHRHLGETARMWLFGSRLDDQKRGGDIDLYVETGPHPLMNELRCKVQLEDALEMPVDLIVRPHDDGTPIANIAKAQGILL